MSISGIANNLYNQYQLSASSSTQQQFQQLSQDLQSGNLSAAQSDFATLQQAFSQPSTTSSPTVASSTSLAPNANPIAQAFNQIGADLQSNNLSAAQKDLSTVQQDLRAQGGPTFNHLRARNILGGDGSNSTSGTGSASPANLAAAQQSYSAFQQELQETAFGAGSSALQDQPPLSLVA